MSSLLVGGCRAVSLVTGFLTIEALDIIGSRCIASKTICTFDGHEKDRPKRAQRVALLALQFLAGAFTMALPPTFSPLPIAAWSIKTLIYHVALPALLQGGCCSILGIGQDYLLKRSNGNYTSRPDERGAVEIHLIALELLAIPIALVSSSFVYLYPLAIIFRATILHLHDLDAFSVPPSIKNMYWQHYSNMKGHCSESVQEQIEIARQRWNYRDPKIDENFDSLMALLRKAPENKMKRV